MGLCTVMKNILFNFLFVLGLICNQFCWSQKIERIEFEHYNAIIVGRGINITFEPIKNNRKEKVRVVVRKDRESFFSRINKDQFLEICSAVEKIKQDSLGTQYTFLDSSSSSITVYDKRRNKKMYYTENLTQNSQQNEKQKDFWYATKLILKSVRLEMKDLINY